MKRKTTKFTLKVLHVVARIPRGKTLSYKEVAARAGVPKAYRAVGTVLKGNFDPNIPCHRVIRSNGTTGEYNRGKAQKIRILKREGVVPKK